jgi:hypothetical protein
MSASKEVQDRQLECKRDIDVRSHDLFCRGKTIDIKYYECMSVLLPYLLGHIVLYCHLWPVWLYRTFTYYTRLFFLGGGWIY